MMHINYKHRNGTEVEVLAYDVFYDIKNNRLYYTDADLVEREIPGMEFITELSVQQ